MSSFKMKAKHNETGEVHDIWAIDDYYGAHVYGYCPNVEGGEFMRYEEFEKVYTPEDELNTNKQQEQE